MITLKELQKQGLGCRSAGRSLETTALLLQNFGKDIKEIRIYREDELKLCIPSNSNSYYLFTRK